MAAQTKRGRIYVMLFILGLALFDLGVKGLLLAEGTLKWSQAIGTVITFIVLWFLWRGSKFAYGFMLCCLALATALTLFLIPQVPAYFVAFFGVAILLSFLALLAPSSRTFLVQQRGSGA